MNAFEQCRKLEDQTKPYIAYWLNATCTSWRETDTFEDQVTKGDYEVIHPEYGKLFIECKTEYRYTMNLFIETFSNANTGRPGWIETCNADLLWYFFMSNYLVFSIPMKVLKRWLRTNDRLNKYKEVVQHKHTQHNRTVGRLLCVEHILRGPAPFNVAVERYKSLLSQEAHSLFDILD